MQTRCKVPRLRSDFRIRPDRSNWTKTPWFLLVVYSSVDDGYLNDTPISFAVGLATPIRTRTLSSCSSHHVTNHDYNRDSFNNKEHQHQQEHQNQQLYDKLVVSVRSTLDEMPHNFSIPGRASQQPHDSARSINWNNQQLLQPSVVLIQLSRRLQFQMSEFHRKLRYEVINFFLTHSKPPTIDRLAATTSSDNDTITDGLQALAAQHHIKLYEPSVPSLSPITMAHPFSHL